MNTPIAAPSGLQRGQILPIFAGGLVAILLIGALVVDLGFVFMTKRHEQNAADPGAVAAARYIRDGSLTSAEKRAAMWTAACFYALKNGFRPTRTDNGLPCDSGQSVDDSTITVHWPPSREAGAFAGNTAYVEVAISRSHESVIAGVVGLGQFIISSAAVAANDDGTGGSSSLVALNPDACSAGNIHGGGGGGGVRIFPATGVTKPGGYVQVNSDCSSGSNAEVAGCAGAQGALTLAGGTQLVSPGAYIVGACNTNGGTACLKIPDSSVACNSTPPHEQTSFIGDPLSMVRPPAPTDLTIRQACTGTQSTATNPKHCIINKDRTLEPGTYYGGWSISGNNTNVILSPGIYIIAGGGISDNALEFTSASGRVLIYSTDASPTWRAWCIANPTLNSDGCQNRIKMDGGSQLNLTGLSFTTPCPPYGTTGCPYGGMLMWQDGLGSAASVGGQRCDISLAGGSQLVLSGTVYAPCGNVTINGNGTESGCVTMTNCAAVQIIADTWDVGGAAVLEMPYDPDAFYHLSLKGLVR